MIRNRPILHRLSRWLVICLRIVVALAIVRLIYYLARPWMASAGQTEWLQVALALWGMYGNGKLLFDVGVDRVIATHDDPADDTEHTARAAFYAQFVLTFIQFIVLVTGITSLFLPPPPPDRFADMFLGLDPRAVMWVVQHLGLMVTSVACVVGARLAQRERIRILEPNLTATTARNAISRGRRAGSDASLFVQVGGENALHGVSVDFYARLKRDPVLFRYFIGVNIKNLERAQVVMLTALLGGPAEPADLRKAHAHLQIPDEDFTRLAEHLRDALHFFGVEPALSQQILARVETTRQHVVKGSGDAA